MADQAVLPASARGTDIGVGELSAAVRKQGQVAQQAMDNISTRDKEIESTLKSLSDQKLDATPPKLNTEQFQPPAQQNPLEAFGSLAMVLATIASFKTRNPLTTSLKAATNAITAIKQNNTEAYNSAFQLWKENSDHAFKQANWEQEQYKTAIDLFKTDQNMALSKLRSLAAINQDEQMKAVIQSGNVDNLIQLYDARQRATTQGAKIAQELSIQGERLKIYNQWKQEFTATNGRPPTAEEASQSMNSMIGGQSRVHSTITGKDGKVYKVFANGNIEEAKGTDGQPIVNATASPELQGDIAAAKTLEAFRAKTRGEREKGLPSVQAAMSTVDARHDKIIQRIDELIGTDGKPGILTSSATGLAGAIGSKLPGIGGKAYDIGQTLSFIKANLGFDELKAMRAASPTGAALGPVSDVENKLLQDAQQALSQGQSLEQQRRNLSELKDDIVRSRKARQQAFVDDYGDLISRGGATAPTASPAATPPATDIDSLLQKYQ